MAIRNGFQQRRGALVVDEVHDSTLSQQLRYFLNVPFSCSLDQQMGREQPRDLVVSSFSSLVVRCLPILADEGNRIIISCLEMR